ncbi:MAG: class I SAM-dependent methyltransferase [Desulfobacteraceae bacterium]|jgi:2-polyprenyl-3-methyl-5-hydroxy-6-metoxy-1,4-benzoquinol methylase|nr:class I SAM-dependent methyltransferase [Desulfobacteraceae bacterium]
MTISQRSISVFWPKFVPPEIFEMHFAYDFCRKESQRLCQTIDALNCWIDYAEGDLLSSFLSYVSANDDLLIITDPLIVLHKGAIEHLQNSLKNGYAACGPVFSDSRYKDQQAKLDFSYHNISTFLEVSQLISTQSESAALLVDQLDPGCILYSNDAIRSAAKDIPVAKLNNFINGVRVVDSGAMLHRFFNIFDSAREDLIALIPPEVSLILDVGCAKGGYGKRLKADRPDVFVAGVEMNPMMAESARQYYDDVFVCSVDSLDLPYPVDLINCGELLEHLENPWKILDSLCSMLNPKGYLVLSVPNAGHWAIVRDLIQGRFQYIPWGPQCITHIRWFTENDIVKALEDAGFSIDLIDRVQPPPTPAGNQFIQDMLDKGYGNREHLLTIEIIIRAQKQ